MNDAGRLAALKAYCRIDYDEDDSLLEAILGTVDAYLQNAGCTRENHENLYDLIAQDMTLRQYDGRDSDTEHAATAPLVRRMLTQLKLVCAFGGAGDGNTSV